MIMTYKVIDVTYYLIIVTYSTLRVFAFNLTSDLFSCLFWAETGLCTYNIIAEQAPEWKKLCLFF